MDVSLSWHQQRLNGTPLVHRAIAFGDLGQGKTKVEDSARVDLSFEHEADERRQVRADGSRPAVQMDVLEEELFAVELDAVRHADIADRAAGTRRVDRLHHGFLRADALEHAV